MGVKDVSRIFGYANFMPEWFADGYGIIYENPFKTDPDLLLEINMKKSKILLDRYPELSLGNANPAPVYAVPQYDGRILCATAYGAPYPVWDSKSGCFWTDRDFIPWEWVETSADVNRIIVPDWNNVRLVQEMAVMYSEYKEKAKHVPGANNKYEWTCQNWTNPNTNEEYNLTGFMTYIDLAPFLFGETRFFTMLAEDPEFACALMEKCFEISVSYAEYMVKLYGYDIKGISGFGGDHSCMLSPAMYKEYAMAFDQMILDRYGYLPCNLHSCGPSSHLYENWGTYGNIHYIVLMQTRAIQGGAIKLRKALPYTHLQLTLHSPQFDFENEEPGNIRDTVWQLAEGVGFKDVDFNVIVTYPGEKVDSNLRTFFKTIDNLNRYIEG